MLIIDEDAIFIFDVDDDAVHIYDYRRRYNSYFRITECTLRL